MKLRRISANGIKLERFKKAKRLADFAIFAELCKIPQAVMLRKRGQNAFYNAGGDVRVYHLKVSNFFPRCT